MYASRPPPYGVRPRPDLVSPQQQSSAWNSGGDASSTSQSRSAPRVRRPEPVQNIGKYRVIKTIGKGNFAIVKLAKHVPTGRLVAIKIIDKSQLSSSSLQKMCREVKVMKSLNHPNIVKLFEVMETNRTMYLVLEYASGGEIFDYLVTKGRMKESDVRAKFRQIVSAVHYCHQKSIVHRDLKAENLLLDRDFNIKIADFGFSNEFNFHHKLNTFCGSPPYAAPELFQGKKYTGPEVDVWSLGVILYTLITGSLPFDGHNLKELKEKVMKGKYSVPFYVPSDCHRLLRKFLVLNPAKRITLEAAMKDKWLNEGNYGDELQPYTEPVQEIDDERIESMISLGYTREQIDHSLSVHGYDDVWAAYHLLALKAPAPSTPGDSVFCRPVRRTASDLPGTRKPPAARTNCAPRLAEFINIGGITAPLNEIADDEDDDSETVFSSATPHPRPTIDSDRSFIGNESASPIHGVHHLAGLQNKLPRSSVTKMDLSKADESIVLKPDSADPPNGHVPVDTSNDQPVTSKAEEPDPVLESSSDSSECSTEDLQTPRNIPLVTLTRSPTSKRRDNPRTRPSQCATPQTATPSTPATPADQEIWVANSAPTRLMGRNAYRLSSHSDRMPRTDFAARVYPRVNSPQSEVSKTPTNPTRSASFTARQAPVTNLTNGFARFSGIPETPDTSDVESPEQPVVQSNTVVGTRTIPPLLTDSHNNNNQTTKLGGTKFRSSPACASSTVPSCDPATIVGVAETAPNWHVQPVPSGRPSGLYDSGYASASGSRFSRNVPTRQTVHGLPERVSRPSSPPLAHQSDPTLSPPPPDQPVKETPEASGLVCGRRHQHSTFFSRLVARIGRKRNVMNTADVRITSV